MNLYLLHYNNYYNRIVKKEDNLSGYLPYMIGTPLQNINFIPGDYINTTQVVNWNYEHPDYLIAVNEDGEIDSRWFVMSIDRLRNQQLNLTLHRDLVVDFYDNIVEGDIMIEKALPKSIRDPAIYNNEYMSFNQIKVKEQALFDETKCPWIVGYVPRDAFASDTTVSVTSQLSGAADVSVESLADWEYYKYKDKTISGEVVNPTIKIQIWYWLRLWNKDSQSYGTQKIFDECYVTLDQNGNYTGIQAENHFESGSFRPDIKDGGGYYWEQNKPSDYTGTVKSDFTDAYARTIVQNMPRLANDFKELSGYLPDATPAADFNAILALNGGIIHETSTNLYYRINVVSIQGEDAANEISFVSGLGQKMDQTLVKSFGGNTLLGPYNNGTVKSPFSFTSPTQYKMLRLEPIEVTLSTTIPNKSRRYHTSESPYDIFCMPYTDNLQLYKNGQPFIKTNKNAALSIAQTVAASVGEANIYDVQLLPYCPVRYLIKAGGILDLEGVSYNEIKAGDSTVNVMFWATTDNIQIQIPLSIPEEQSIIEKKVKNETDFIRICSPNFSSGFEMSPQMNEGVDYVTVICHYKPFNPYIKVQPNFKGLYGNAYNDARGLICSGDFSLAQATSAWANYELQNKNYQQIFNREIQNLKVNNAVQKEQEIWNVVSGTIGAGVSGATAGTMATGGNPLGAFVGLGTAGLSLAGGIRDVQLGDTLREETLDYRKDLFGYQLRNIKALPQGLSKTSAISPDNKLVPFVEYYSCTEAEKDALRNKIKYNGCTIMMIGKMSQYIRKEPTYIKGKLIRLSETVEDFDIINAIANELFKGVFI